MKYLLILCLAVLAAAAPAPKVVNDAKCGVGKITPGRITGGQEVHKGQYPWMASLTFLRFGLMRTHVCGCSIIDDQWILSASHCFMNSDNPTRYSVRVGLHDVTDREAEMQEIKVAKVIKHEGFEASTKTSNDIALIKLAKKIDFSSEYVNRICLPTAKNLTTDGLVLTVAGWGDTVTGDSQNPSSVLMETNLESKPEAYCKKQWGRSMWADNQAMCAEADNSSPCVGDSGGPLFMTDDNDGHMTQVGVVSFGEKTCHGPRPPVFTRVAYFLDWIKQKMAENA